MNTIYEGDIVFLSNKELGIKNVDPNKNRPCIILHIEGNDPEGYCYVIHMTTQKGREGDYNRQQYKLQSGSYVKLNSEPKIFLHRQLTYAEQPTSEHIHKYALTDKEFNDLYDNYKSFWT